MFMKLINIKVIKEKLISFFSMFGTNNENEIKNNANAKHLYIKIGRQDKRNLIFFSTTTNDKGSFHSKVRILILGLMVWS